MTAELRPKSLNAPQTRAERTRLARNLAEVIDDLYRSDAPPRHRERVLDLCRCRSSALCGSAGSNSPCDDPKLHVPSSPPMTRDILQAAEQKGNRTMTQESKNLTTHDTEVENIQIAAQEDAGFERILKFKKGDFIGDEDVPIGTEYVAHVRAWGKCWIKFVDGQVAERTWLRGYSAGHLLESALSSYGWLRGRAGVTERAEIAKDCAAVRTSAIRSAFDNRPPRIRSAVSMAVVCLSRATATRRGRGATAIS
jgi:hypothetical protein